MTSEAAEVFRYEYETGLTECLK